MAFECHNKTKNLLSDKSLVDRVDPWEEEDDSTPLRSCNNLKGNSQSNCQSIIPILSSEILNTELPIPDNSATDSCQNIIDLPPALVYEIFHFLDAKELGIVSCVSTLLHRIASSHHGWKDLYCQRWRQPSISLGFREEKSWKDLFVEREFRSKAFMGRYRVDVLYGHTDAVRSVFLLPAAKLIFTGGYDSIVRVWDMEDCLSVASSRPLGCTIRTVTADTGLLVVGGSDGFLQCWKAIEGHPHLFDLTGSQSQKSDFRLWEHEGPVTCIALDQARICSGSWDMTIRIWDRTLFKCLKVLRHRDWVYSLVARGSTIASTAGDDVYVWDLDKGNLDMVIQNPHVGTTYSVACNQTGNLIFTGGADGVIKMFKITDNGIEKDITRVATWSPHTDRVHSLAFEFPWLVSASSDGKLALIDIRKLLTSSSPNTLSKVKHSVSGNTEVAQRMLHGFGRNLFSVGISSDRIVCGGEEGVVRVWNFSQALEIERRVQTLRGMRLENRMRRRNVQIEMNNRNSRNAQCSFQNQMNSNRNNEIGHSRRRVSGKLKA